MLFCLLRFFDTMFLLISVSKKLGLKPLLHVWRCVEDADRAKIVEVCDGVLCKCVYVYYIAQWATAFLEALMLTGRDRENLTAFSGFGPDGKWERAASIYVSNLDFSILLNPSC